MRIVIIIFITLFHISCNNGDKEKIGQEDRIQETDSTNLFKPKVIEVKLSFQVDNSFGIEVSQLLSNFLTELNNGGNWSQYYSTESLSFVRFPMSNFYSIRFDNKTFIEENPTLISLYKLNEDTIAKIHFSRMDTSGYSNILATLNVGVKRSNNRLVLVDMLYLNSNTLTQKKHEEIEYFYAGKHKFNEALADKMLLENRKFAKFFDLNLKEIKFFIKDNTIEINNLRGFDYKYDMFNLSENSGLSNSTNRVIFSGNGSEYYSHELVHLYLDHKVNNEGHFWFHEGLATYLGDSRGYDLSWHLKEVKLYLDKIKETRSNEIFELPVMITEYTGLPYAIGGLICKLTDEKGGKDALMRLFTYGNSNENFYSAIESELGIKQQDLLNYIDNYLEKKFKQQIN